MLNKEKNFVSIVAYVHNCENHIENFLTQIYNLLVNNFETFEIIFVDDSSADNSINIIKEVTAGIHGSSTTVINMSYFQGLEASMNAGVDFAVGDFVYEFDDCVIDYDLNLMMDIYRRSLEGFDIVSARRDRNRIFSRLFYSIFNGVSNLQYKINSESFRILSRRAINRVHSMSKDIPYRKALYADCGLKSDFLLYAGKDKNSDGRRFPTYRNEIDVALTAFILFSNIAYKIAMTITIFMMLCTLIGVIYVIAIYKFQSPVPGYTTTMLVLTGSFFAVFFLLAIVLKYLTILVSLIFKKKQYIIRSIDKFTK
jgi:dolichol-phosphate mannosyltransferase